MDGWFHPTNGRRHRCVEEQEPRDQGCFRVTCGDWPGPPYPPPPSYPNTIRSRGFVSSRHSRKGARAPTFSLPFTGRKQRGAKPAWERTGQRPDGACTRTGLDCFKRYSADQPSAGPLPNPPQVGEGENRPVVRATTPKIAETSAV